MKQLDLTRYLLFFEILQIMSRNARKLWFRLYMQNDRGHIRPYPSRALGSNLGEWSTVGWNATPLSASFFGIRLGYGKKTRDSLAMCSKGTWVFDQSSSVSMTYPRHNTQRMAQINRACSGMTWTPEMHGKHSTTIHCHTSPLSACMLLKNSWNNLRNLLDRSHVPQELPFSRGQFIFPTPLFCQVSSGTPT